jgi:hypothetical protein
VVNGETGAVGNPNKIKEQFDHVRLRIAPVPGNSSYGSPICGEVRATPTPQVTEAPPQGGGGPSPGSEPPKPSPSGDCKNPNKPGCASTPPTPAAALLLSITGLLAPIVELRRRRTRRRAA